MRRTMLKSKVHRARVTHSELDYEGSIAIDSKLLDAADMREYERVEIYNVTNGERFVTYTIRAEAGSGIISINGAAAHKASPGDIIIICSYADFEERELASFNPRLVYVDAQNRIARIGNAIPAQVA
ncbi:MAG: aspartate 1-decarboxylase [Candidatus Muproteobacteria bacterium RBG_16_60_9]|uniref:Aspartate 1-decarboxylase n=1 Tax=Candidatus Muproteobacteria bacterium RBG_16_60_9 TaxID=1817755 RepID=A0A1F6UVJ7_9PROT|nr:MAG: aspartate 1-decarboxylase [Candidatus Muproteobacteria bacterium RBG_16_60_9]